MNDEALRIVELCDSKDYVAAEAALHRLALANSDDPWVYYKLARVYQKLGDKPEAVDAAMTAVTLAPDWADARRTYAWALHFANASPAATDVARQALTMDPQPESFSTLAWVLAKARKPIESMEIADQGLWINPLHDGLLCAKVRALLDLKRWPEAIEVVTRVLDVGSNKYFPHAALGGCYYMLRNYSLAETSLARALQIEPHAPSTRAIYREVLFLKWPGSRLWRHLFPKELPVLPYGE